MEVWHMHDATGAAMLEAFWFQSLRDVLFLILHPSSGKADGAEDGSVGSVMCMALACLQLDTQNLHLLGPFSGTFLPPPPLLLLPLKNL
ncbi:hypothetical protein EYF80_037404 [Liparis tanakae]|uniref:Uncharacterized protein n=1 Tax=Liparis tanakae TaxID=230148 RepID=A0A4Z2GGN0_9TELE|nr:hypothetical protein EYF80_037404 [Liparis tanakae]